MNKHTEAKACTSERLRPAVLAHATVSGGAESDRLEQGLLDVLRLNLEEQLEHSGRQRVHLRDARREEGVGSRSSGGEDGMAAAIRRLG